MCGAHLMVQSNVTENTNLSSLPNDNGILKKCKRLTLVLETALTRLNYVFLFKIFFCFVELTDPTGFRFVGPKHLYVVVVS